MRKNLISIAVSVVLVQAFAASVAAETLSNRHHLSGCTVQSAPVVIPYATARTVRLGLPADLEGQAHVSEIYGYDEETRLRLRGGGLSVRTQGGGATLVMPHETGCQH